MFILFPVLLVKVNALENHGNRIEPKNSSKVDSHVNLPRSPLVEPVHSFTMGFAPFHAHKAHPKIHRRAASPGCSTGGLYNSPTNGATVDSQQPLEIKWDSSCLEAQKVDIHLLAPGYNGDTTEITVWSAVPNADAQKSVTVQPAWWNSTSQVQVQLVIVPAGIPPAMTPLPAGPIFTFTYTGTAAESTSSAAEAAVVSSATSKSLSPGATAAAVLLPLLFVGLAVFAYLRYQRRRASAQSKRFSQALDKRMSTISTDWKSISAAGAQAAIRSSMAQARDSAAFSFGHIRPSIDAPAPAAAAAAPPQMKQVRTGTGVGLRNPGAAAAIAAERASRVSRVSFADTLGRPSTDSRRTRGPPARGSAYVPPVPPRKDVVSGVPSVYPDSEVESEVEASPRRGMHVQPMSPRQTSGPLTLTPEDIRARMHGRLSPAPEKNEEYDEVMPALSSTSLRFVSLLWPPADTARSDAFILEHSRRLPPPAGTTTCPRLAHLATHAYVRHVCVYTPAGGTSDVP